jgi:hypothetical protein
MQAHGHGAKRRRRHSKGGGGGGGGNGNGKKSPRPRASQGSAAVPQCRLTASATALPRLQIPDVPAHQRGICACDAVAWVVLAALLFVSPV